MSEFTEAMDVFFNGRSPGELNEAGKRIMELENQLRESFERIERMRITMEELRREKFSVGAIHMRYPGLDYSLQILHMYQTPNGQVIIVGPLPFTSNPGSQP